MAGAWIGGKPVALGAAAQEAARLLAASRLPLIAGLGTDIAGARAAIALADRVGAVVDHMHSDAVLRNLGVMRESGMMITTASEAGRRADVVLLVGPCRVMDASPGLAERLLARPTAEPDGAERRILWLCPRPNTERFAIDDRTFQYLARDIEIERMPLYLAALRARIAGRPLGETTFHRRNLDRLAAQLKNAKFGVAIWSAAELDPLAIEMLCGMVGDLNAHTRFTGFPLLPSDNAEGVLQACGWMTGFPMRTGFARGYPEHDPWRFDARRLIESGEADCLVYIAAYERTVSPVYDPALTTIALGGPDTSGRDDAHVRIKVGRPGLDHDAVEHNARASTLVPSKASKPSDAISVVDAIAAIAAHLPGRGASRGSRPC